MEQDVKNAFENLKTSSKAYIKLSLILLKLNVYEKTAMLIGVISYSLVFITVGVISVIFMLIVLGFGISYLFDNMLIGFFIVFLICLAMLTLVYINRENIKMTIINTVISTLEQKNGLKNIDNDTSK